MADYPPQQRSYHRLDRQQKQQRYRELAAVFFKLGAIAFGGPAAHIAMMEDEVVNKRQWLSRQSLLDLLGVTSLIPGPNSTELAIHIGYERAGWRGLIIAGCCFIFPAMVLVWILAAIYVRYQSLPQIESVLYGIKPVIAVIVIQALGKLGRKAAKDLPTQVAAVAVIVAFVLGFNELLLLLLAGLAVMLVKWHDRNSLFGVWLFSLAEASTQVETATTNNANWHNVFFFFLKVGSVLYGSGYVLLAFLQEDLVERSQWLTSQQLLDAVAIAQVTPGPVFTTATFIGYLLAGNIGAIAATIGIFLPAFALVAIVNPWIPKLRNSALAAGFLDGVNAASVGLMAVVTYTLTRAAVVDWLTVTLIPLSAIALVRFRVNSAWLIVTAGAIGLAWQWLI